MTEIDQHVFPHWHPFRVWRLSRTPHLALWQAAHDIGTRPNTLCGIELGRIKCSERFAKRMHEISGISIEALVNWTAPKEWNTNDRRPE